MFSTFFAERKALSPGIKCHTMGHGPRRGAKICGEKESGQKMLRLQCQKNLKGVRPTIFNYGQKLSDNFWQGILRAPTFKET